MDSWTDPDTYFTDTAIQILVPFLARHGFDLAGSSLHSVEFTRGRSTLRVSCDTVKMASPWPLVVAVGLIERDGWSGSVALWRLLDDDEQKRVVEDWSFQDQRSLAIALQRLVAEGLAIYGPVLWDDDVEVRRLLDEQRAEVDRTRAEHERRVGLSLARHAFEQGEHRLALERYAQLDPEDLTAADRRRRYVAEQALDDRSRS